MARVAWASVALLLVLGMLASVATLQWSDRGAPEAMGDAYMIVGWAGVGGSLIVGALGLWARAPATLATALGILGAGAFAAAWLAVLPADDATSRTIVLAFVSVVVAFAASLRRPA